MINGPKAYAARLSLTRPLQQLFSFSIRTFQRHPFLVKTLSSGIGFAVGDSLTQLATRRKGELYDWPRTAAIGATGLCIAGPLGYLLIVWMESNILPTAPTSRLAISIKVTLDQVLGCLVWQSALLSINEAYRAAAMDLWHRAVADSRKRLPGLMKTRTGLVAR